MTPCAPMGRSHSCSVCSGVRPLRRTSSASSARLNRPSHAPYGATRWISYPAEATQPRMVSRDTPPPPLGHALHTWYRACSGAGRCAHAVAAMASAQTSTGLQAGVVQASALGRMYRSRTLPTHSGAGLARKHLCFFPVGEQGKVGRAAGGHRSSRFPRAAAHHWMMHHKAQRWCRCVNDRCGAHMPSKCASGEAGSS